MTPDEQKAKDLIEKALEDTSHTFVYDTKLENGDDAEVKTTVGLDGDLKPTVNVELEIKF